MKQKTSNLPQIISEYTTEGIPSVPALPPHMRSHRPLSELPPIRRLQLVAMAVALAWVICSFLASHHMVSRVTEADFDRQNEKAQSQAVLIAQVIEKELHLAEQIGVALSQEADIIMLTQEMNARHAELSSMSQAEREKIIRSSEQSQRVDALFNRLKANVDLLSVFLLDKQGFCIASGFMENRDGGVKRGCWGGNYADRDYFQRAKREGDGRQFAVGRRIPEPSLFSAREVNRHGEFEGAVVVRVDAHKLVDHLRTKPSVTWVADQQGVIISSTRDALLFHHVGQSHHAVPDTELVEQVHAPESIRSIPLQKDRGSPAAWKLWRLNGTPMVFHRTRVPGRDFSVWHGFSVESSLAIHKRTWFFAFVMVAAGLLFVLVVERVADFHQRRVANMAELAAVNRSLEELSDRLYTIATKDHLTHVSSRGFFMQQVKDAVRGAQLEKRPLCFLQLDIDFFKRINDTYGHPTGDAVIRRMADLCRKVVRGRDHVGRLGGEEFALCLVDCEVESALEVAEQLRRSTEATPLRFEGATVRFTCSIGVTPLTPGATPEMLLSASDQALYRAKKSGRNCVKLQDGQLTNEADVHIA